jgi:hypothetical protein
MKSLTLWNDPIIAELHALRAKLVQEAGNDIQQLVLNAKKTAQSLRQLRASVTSKLVLQTQ